MKFFLPWQGIIGLNMSNVITLFPHKFNYTSIAQKMTCKSEMETCSANVNQQFFKISAIYKNMAIESTIYAYTSLKNCKLNSGR